MKNCFLDRERICRDDCVAYQGELNCRLVTSVENISRGMKKISDSLSRLTSWLDHRPPPKP